MSPCKQSVPVEGSFGMMQFCFLSAEVDCAFCEKSLCPQHAHIVDNDRVVCPDCLAGLGGVE